MSLVILEDTTVLNTKYIVSMHIKFNAKDRDYTVVVDTVNSQHQFSCDSIKKAKDWIKDMCRLMEKEVSSDIASKVEYLMQLSHSHKLQAFTGDIVSTTPSTSELYQQWKEKQNG